MSFQIIAWMGYIGSQPGWWVDVVSGEVHGSWLGWLVDVVSSWGTTERIHWDLWEMGPFIIPFAVFKPESREVLTWNPWYFSLRWYMYINLANFNTYWHTQVPVCMQVVNSNVNVWQKFQNGTATEIHLQSGTKCWQVTVQLREENKIVLFAWNWTLLKCILHIFVFQLVALRGPTSSKKSEHSQHPWYGVFWWSVQCTAASAGL